MALSEKKSTAIALISSISFIVGFCILFAYVKAIIYPWLPMHLIAFIIAIGIFLLFYLILKLNPNIKKKKEDKSMYFLFLICLWVGFLSAALISLTEAFGYKRSESFFPLMGCIFFTLVLAISYSLLTSYIFNPKTKPYPEHKYSMIAITACFYLIAFFLLGYLMYNYDLAENQMFASLFTIYVIFSFFVIIQLLILSRKTNKVTNN